VYRIMRVANPRQIASMFRTLRDDPIAGNVTRTGLEYFKDMFGRRTGIGIAMAERSLRLAIPAAQIRTLSISFTEAVTAET
jgi:hypothetical protein